MLDVAPPPDRSALAREALRSPLADGLPQACHAVHCIGEVGSALQAWGGSGGAAGISNASSRLRRLLNAQTLVATRQPRPIRVGADANDPGAAAASCGAPVAEEGAEGGDAIVKLVTATHYTAALLRSGILVLFYPGGWARNGHPEPSQPTAHGDEAALVVPCDGEFVVDVAAGKSHFVFCTASGAVYSFGWCNTHGQLGDGTVWDTWPSVSSRSDSAPFVSVSGRPALSPPRRIPGFGAPLAEGLTGAAEATAPTTYASMREPQLGELDGATATERPSGSPDPYLCALGSQSSIAAATIAANPFPRSEAVLQHSSRGPTAEIGICAVACGDRHTLLLTFAHNAVYACGDNGDGQLGMGWPVPRTAPPPSGTRPFLPLLAAPRSIRLLYGVSLRQIVAAAHHSLVLLESGKLLGFGDNAFGQLGTGDTRRVTTPTPVTFLDTWLPPLEPCAAADPGDAQGGSRGLHDPMGVAATVGPLGASCGFPAAMDSKALASLRAPYDSVQSYLAPLRVRRIAEDLEVRRADDAAGRSGCGDASAGQMAPCRAGPPHRVVAVDSSRTMTIALTVHGELYSCGSRPSYPAYPAGSDGAGGGDRVDAHRHIGRPLASGRAEAWRLGRMAITSTLQAGLLRIAHAARLGPPPGVAADVPTPAPPPAGADAGGSQPRKKAKGHGRRSKKTAARAADTTDGSRHTVTPAEAAAASRIARSRTCKHLLTTILAAFPSWLPVPRCQTNLSPAGPLATCLSIVCSASFSAVTLRLPAVPMAEAGRGDPAGVVPEACAIPRPSTPCRWAETYVQGKIVGASGQAIVNSSARARSVPGAAPTGATASVGTPSIPPAPLVMGVDDDDAVPVHDWLRDHGVAGSVEQVLPCGEGLVVVTKAMLPAQLLHVE